MLRLIDATDGDVVGADIPTVIRTLGDAIFHVHAKDIRTNDWIAARDGLLDTVPITEPDSRAWNYVTHGLGHPGGATFWADFVYNLRSVGYDGTLSIEHEDDLVPLSRSRRNSGSNMTASPGSTASPGAPGSAAAQASLKVTSVKVQ